MVIIASARLSVINNLHTHPHTNLPVISVYSWKRFKRVKPTGNQAVIAVAMIRGARQKRSLFSSNQLIIRFSSS